jgi:hypothetical protein
MDGQFPSGGGGGMGGQAAAEEDYSKLSLEDRLSSKVSTGKSKMTICYKRGSPSISPPFGTVRTA